MHTNPNGIEFTPDYRSLFLDTLRTRPGYSNIYEQGIKEFHNNIFFVKNKNNVQNNFNQALKVLQDGINKERNTEQNYFNNLLSGYNTDLSELKKELNSIFSNSGEFNYVKFIELINTILLGTQQFKEILKIERERSKELTQSMKNLTTALKKEGKTEQEIKLDIKNTYLERHSYNNSDFSSYFNNITPTVDYTLAQYINTLANKILTSDEILQKIKLAIINKNMNINDFKTLIINNILKQVNLKTGEILQAIRKKNTKELNILTNSIEQALQQDLEKIEINGQKINFGIKNGTKAISIKDGIITTSGEGLANNLIKARQNFQNDNNPITQILKKQINSEYTGLQLLDDIINETKLLDNQIKQNNSNNNTINAEELKQLETNIINKKRQLSTFVHSQIKQKIEQADETATKLLIAEDLKESLTVDTVKITGPEFSEIIDSVIQEHFSSNNISFFSGPINLKADSIVISINPNNYTSTNISSELGNKLFKTIKANVKNFYDDFQKNLPKTGEATSFKKGRESFFNSVKNQQERLVNELNKDEKEDETQVDILNQIAEKMRSNIFVTETMKTFNQYNNDIGFVSGSIGPTIMSQLDNMAELFEQAGVGMTDNEKEWLATAIVNCSSPALGDSNQGPIEKYLSTLAGFAVFDEGSAELNLLTSKTENFYTSHSPQIMHLYKLNGLYFPGSYVLQKIYNNLTETSSLFEQTLNTGDGVKIRATGSSSNIDESIHDLNARWSKTFENASKSEYTSINITFLSGLFNIVNQLYYDFNPAN